jgi:SOS response regulatory protein OraA/RecX
LIVTEEERARAYLLKLFRYRPRSRSEAFVRLRQKGFSEAVVTSVLEEAARAGIVDDAKFAKLWVADRLARRPRSRRLLERNCKSWGSPQKKFRELSNTSSLTKKLSSSSSSLSASLRCARSMRRFVNVGS